MENYADTTPRMMRQVRMLTSEREQEVRVLGAEGRPLPADVAEQVLLLIREYAT